MPGLPFAEIKAYLLLLGATPQQIQECNLQLPELQRLALSLNGDLGNEAAVRAAPGKLERDAALAKRAPAEPLSIEAKKRYRLAFDHYDKDSSGELDIDEFREAMIDSGMMPFGAEVRQLFLEADADHSGTIDFEEYCTMVQAYKGRQGLCDKLSEALVDLFSPAPAYLSDHKEPFVRKMRNEGCNKAATQAFVRNFEVLRSNADLMIAEIDILPAQEHSIA
jgi:hypothetical protein